MFEDIFDIVAADFMPKPEAATYERFFDKHDVDPARSVMFEDLARNLVVPHARGMTTALVVPKPGQMDHREAFEIASEVAPPHIDFVTSDLEGFPGRYRRRRMPRSTEPRRSGAIDRGACTETSCSAFELPLSPKDRKMRTALEKIIDAAFEDRANINAQDARRHPRGRRSRPCTCSTPENSASPKRSTARPGPASWHVNQWLKKAVLLSFRLNDMAEISGGPGGATWWDKVPSKFAGWGAKEHAAAGFRSVPNCVVRRSAYIAPGVVLMPSFVNLGAYVDSGIRWSIPG